MLGHEKGVVFFIFITWTQLLPRKQKVRIYIESTSTEAITHTHTHTHTHTIIFARI